MFALIFWVQVAWVNTRTNFHDLVTDVGLLSKLLSLPIILSTGTYQFRPDISPRLFRAIAEIYFSVLFLTSCLRVSLTCCVCWYPGLSDPCLIWLTACLPDLFFLLIIWASLTPVRSLRLPVPDTGSHLSLRILEIRPGLHASHCLHSSVPLSCPWLQSTL